MTENPTRDLPPEAMQVVRTWAQWKATNLWPDAGGLNDQSAWLMDGFGILSEAISG